MHEADRVIRHDRGDPLLRGCQQRLRLRPGPQLVEVDVRDRVRYDRQLGVAGVDRADTSGDPAKRLKPRGIGFDGLVARAIDVLDEQQSSLLVGTGGDDARRWDAPGAGKRDPTRLELLCLGRLGRADTQHGAASADGGLVTHQPRRAALAQACHGDEVVAADGRKNPLHNDLVERGIHHKVHATRLSSHGTAVQSPPSAAALSVTERPSPVEWPGLTYPPAIAEASNGWACRRSHRRPGPGDCPEAGLTSSPEKL